MTRESSNSVDKKEKDMNLLNKFNLTQASFDNIKDKLNKENNLVDYFLIVGVNPNLCHQNFLYETTINELNTTYISELKPTILSKYPPFEKSYVNVDNGIINYCFPNKFLIKESTNQPNIEIFSFILDNYYFSLNFPQKYVTCLVFYENLKNYKTLKQLINPKKQKETIYKQPIINKSSKDKNASNDISTKSKNLKSLRSISHERTSKYIRKRYKLYYIPKCIVLISVYPVFNIQEEILKTIYSYSMINNNRIPIEKILLNFLVEVPLPPRGISSIEFSLIDKTKVITQNKMNELRDVEAEIYLTISNLGIKNTIDIFKHLLLETKCIFFCSKRNLLSPIIYGLINLIFPFKYPFQVLTCIPEENFGIIESITPYIFGINKEYTSDFFEKKGIDIIGLTLLIIDIDNNKLYFTSKEKVPELPEHYTKKLTKEITENFEKEKNIYNIRVNKRYCKEKNNFKFMVSKEFDSYGRTREFSLQFPFFQFNINIMQLYSKYLNNEYFTLNSVNKLTNIDTLFKVDSFISTFSSSDKPFITQFVKETQIFSDFIYKRMIPKDMKDKLDILFFDEFILLKKNRKLFSIKQDIIFITSHEYDLKENYQVPKPRELNQFEIKNYYSSLYRNYLLTKGQYISINNNNISFSYPIFPLLNNDSFYFNIGEYVFPPSFTKDIQKINSNLLSKSHLNSIVVSNAEMENYIYLAWLEIIARTFWYIDPCERVFRFKQILEVLDKVLHHEMEILNLLFEALSKKGEDEMAIILYDKLISYQLSPSLYIYSIISKILEKKKIKEDPNFNPIDYLNEIPKEKNQLPSKFRKRTLKTRDEINDMTILGERVKFNTISYCPECNEGTINLLKISRDFSRMKKDFFWAYCDVCKNYILPKIDIKIGNEIYKNKNFKSNSAVKEFQVLHSPYNLKEGIGQVIADKKFLDVNCFREMNGSLFWSAIWYFKLNGLDYNILLPYVDNIRERKKINEVLQEIEMVIKVDPSKAALTTSEFNKNKNKSIVNEEEKKVSVNDNSIFFKKRSHSNRINLFHLFFSTKETSKN